MSTIEPPDGEVSESSNGEVGPAQDATGSGSLIMAEVADPDIDGQLSAREDSIGERKEMGPPIDWDAASAELEAAPMDDSPDAGETTPVPLDSDG